MPADNELVKHAKPFVPFTMKYNYQWPQIDTQSPPSGLKNDMPKFWGQDSGQHNHVCHSFLWYRFVDPVLHMGVSQNRTY